MKGVDTIKESKKLLAHRPLSFSYKTFEELDLQELYTILAFRAEVFVVEQNCPYQDLDGQDQQAIHVQISQDGQLIAYARIFSADVLEGPNHVLGRILVRENFRKKGMGDALVENVLNYISNHWNAAAIKISAQLHLKDFYGKHGFRTKGESYLEDGIPHIAMIRPLAN